MKIPRPGRARVLGFAAALSLFAMLLPAAAGVALGHDASGTCDKITLSNSALNANIYVGGTYSGGYTNQSGYHYGTGTLVETVAGDATYIIAPGTYDVVWTDGVKVTSVVVGQCSPSIATVDSPSTGKVGLAMAVGDTATLSSVVAFSTGSSVTFSLYHGTSCTGTPVVTGSGLIGAVSAGKASASYTDSSWTPSAAGTYTWGVSFAGDTYNKSVSACGGDKETVYVSNRLALTITTLLSESTGKIGDSVNDTATLSPVQVDVVPNSVNLIPTGTVTYTVYTNSTCTTGAIDAGTVTLVDGMVPNSNPITFNMAGTWYWQAVYSGDNYFNSETSTCMDEPLTIAPNGPSIATLLSESSGVVGDSVNDSATLSGATKNAGGTVKYTVYTDSECTIGAQDAGTVAVASGLVPNSNPITFSDTGTYYWQAVYSGDANNAGATSACTSETLLIDPSPFQSFQGETATPTAAGTTVVEAATGTPVITPAVTSTDGSSPSGDSTPLFALLICFAFGGLGLAAVEAQRRSIRR